jgi:hypothetical protein
MRFTLEAYAGPIPLRVVPIFWPAGAASSLAPSISYFSISKAKQKRERRNYTYLMEIEQDMSPITDNDAALIVDSLVSEIFELLKVRGNVQHHSVSNQTSVFFFFFFFLKKRSVQKQKENKPLTWVQDR